MRVISIPVPGPVGFFRHVGPMSAMLARGHNAGCVHETSGHTREQIIESIEAADVVSVGSLGGMFENRSEPFKNMRGVLVYEIDDNYWAWAEDPASSDPKYQEANDRLEAHITPERLRQVESWLAGADLVTTTTEALAEVLRAHGARDVAVCPNAVGPGCQRQRPRRIITPPVPGVERSRAERLREERHARAVAGGARSPIDKRVGWSGQIVHKHDLSPVLTALQSVMGTDATVGASSLGPVDFRRMPEWQKHRFNPPGYRKVVVNVGNGPQETTPVELYFATIETMNVDVAVIPLRASPFNLTKSDITLLGWAVQGVPVVCSRTGPYARAEAEGFPAVYVDHEDAAAWALAIRGLLYDRERARAQADAALAWVLEKRSYPAAVRPWEVAFERVARAKGVELDLCALSKINGSGREDEPIFDPERGHLR